MAVLVDRSPIGGIKSGMIIVRPVIDKDDKDNVHTSNTECQHRQKGSITDWRKCAYRVSTVTLDHTVATQTDCGKVRAYVDAQATNQDSTLPISSGPTVSTEEAS